MSMDASMLKALLNSCEDVAKDIEGSQQYKQLDNDDFQLPSDLIMTGLCKSLTNLLSYNVSTEAYQRYSVRIHVIEFLRDCSRISRPFSSLKVFNREENTANLVESLILKHLTSESLDRCINSDSSDALVPSLRALTFFAKNNVAFAKKAEEIIVRMCQLELSDNSRKFLCDLAKNHANSPYEQSVIELIFAKESCKLIEEPLLNSFVSSCPELSDVDKGNNAVDEPEISTEELFEFVVKSPATFRLISSCMKEMMIRTNYAPSFLDFIKRALSEISVLCNNRGKDILDLHPPPAQPIIIMLRIDPSSHTANSKKCALDTLRDIYLNNKEDALVLLSQFPDWLNPFATFLKIEANRSSSDLPKAE